MWGKITIKDVADKCGVSTATISRAINNTGYVTNELRSYILQTCQDMGYIPNSTARSLKVNSTCMIGYITSDISNQYHITVAKALEDVVRPSNYNLIVCSTRDNREKEEQYLKLLLGRNIDALVINSTCENDKLIISISQSLPTVLVNRRLNLPGFHGDFADSDNIQGVYLLTKELLEYGHKRIYILEGPDKFCNARERYEGFRRAMAEVNIDTNDNYPYRYKGDFSEASGYNSIVYMLEKFEHIPTAIISTNNSMTIGILKALQAYHISIPEQLSVVGFNGINNLELMSVRPTVADFDPYDIGKAAGRFLLERIKDRSLENREAIFNPVIIPGNATAPPRII
ncbi:transcriptional regulator, LacI family [Lachnospiraceae bacterium NLAE-zl-G231]|nr:transcriptional regulator, LacI family [Lachnospiraceae bacterium NLAE-zl-G231]